MARGGGGRSGFTGKVISFFTFLFLCGLVLAFFKLNNINSSSELISFLRHESRQAKNCSDSVSNGGKCNGRLPSGGTVAPGEGANPSTPGKLPGDWVVAPPTDSTQVNEKAPGAKKTAGGTPVETPLEVFQAALAKIRVAAPERGASYKRAEWTHWIGTPCDARQQALINQALVVDGQRKATIKHTATSACTVTTGEWVDPYASDSNGDHGDHFTDPMKLDVASVAPLPYVAVHGGQGWPQAKRQAYANDQTILVVTSTSENKKKGDKGPSAYMPPKDASACGYSKMWITAASKYGFTIDAKDKAVLQEALATCKA